MNVTETARRQVLDEVGYVVWKNLLDPDPDLLPLFEEYDRLIDDVSARMEADGVVADRYSDLPLGDRVIRLAVESRGQVFAHTDIYHHTPRRATQLADIARCSATRVFLSA